MELHKNKTLICKKKWYLISSNMPMEIGDITQSFQTDSILLVIVIKFAQFSIDLTSKFHICVHIFTYILRVSEVFFHYIQFVCIFGTNSFTKAAYIVSIVFFLGVPRRQRNSFFDIRYFRSSISLTMPDLFGFQILLIWSRKLSLVGSKSGERAKMVAR